MIAKKKSSKKGTSVVIVPPIEVESSSDLFDQNNISDEPKSTYNKQRNYYIQYNVSNLYDCFSSGLIVPAVFIKERTCEDVQNKFRNSLLFSKGYIDFFDKTQCLLEITFKPDELDYSVQNAFLFNNPLPITRIKHIIVKDHSVKQKILNTARTQDVGFIPEDIFSYFDLLEYQKVELNEMNPKSMDSNLKNEIEIFDKILGLFACIKNQQLYYTKTTKIISNYSEHFLEAFSIINNKTEAKLFNYIKPEFVKAFIKLFDYNNSDVSNPSSYIVNYLYSGGLIDNDFIEIFFELFGGLVPEKKDLLFELKNKLLSPIGKKSTLKPLFEINKIFYQVAYLYIYGKKGSNDLEILKNLIQDELIYSQSEITLALLGMYYGYRQLRPSETIMFNDSKIERIFGTEYNLKFKLNNKLDYSLIESIYEFVFNKKSANEQILAFQPIVKENLHYLTEIKGDPDFEIELDIELFESHIYKIKKRDDIDKLSHLLSIFPEKLQSHLHLVAFIRKHYDKDFYLLRGSNDIVFKSELLVFFREGKLQLIDFDHLIACVELDKKFNLK